MQHEFCYFSQNTTENAFAASLTPICLFTEQLVWLYCTIKINLVINQNSVWPCVKDHIAICMCAKSRQP